MGSEANGLMKDTKEALFNAPLADQKLGFIMATAKKAVLAPTSVITNKAVLLYSSKGEDLTNK